MNQIKNKIFKVDTYRFEGEYIKSGHAYINPYTVKIVYIADNFCYLMGDNEYFDMKRTDFDKIFDFENLCEQK